MSTTTTTTGTANGRPATGAQRSTPLWRGGTAKGPSPARHRRPALIGLALLLIVGGAAIAGLLAVRIDSRVPVLVAAREIAVGQQITRGDLATTRVASEGLTLLSADSASQVVGQYAAQTVPAGRLLDAGMLSGQGFLKPGTSAVGVSVGTGKMPASGLRSGDAVQVVSVKDGQGKVLVGSAVVSSVAGGESGGSFIGGGSSSGTVATLIVGQDQAASVAAASAANQVALVLLSRGAQLGSG